MVLRHALAFEAELARAEAAEGLISAEAAETIASLCGTIAIDPAELSTEAALDGTLAIPLVARLRKDLPEAAAKDGSTQTFLDRRLHRLRQSDASERAIWKGSGSRSGATVRPMRPPRGWFSPEYPEMADFFDWPRFQRRG